MNIGPPEKAIVLSVADQSRERATQRAQSLLPMRPAQARRPTPDVVRKGTT
jgi:hypothetical protein